MIQIVKYLNIRLEVHWVDPVFLELPVLRTVHHMVNHLVFCVANSRISGLFDHIIHRFALGVPRSIKCVGDAQLQLLEVAERLVQDASAVTHSEGLVKQRVFLEFGVGEVQPFEGEADVPDHFFHVDHHFKREFVREFSL